MQKKVKNWVRSKTSVSVFQVEKGRKIILDPGNTMSKGFHE